MHDTYDSVAAGRYSLIEIAGTTYEPGFRQLQALLMRCGDPKRVLDFGCGAGRSTRFASQLFPSAHVTGVDISSEMLAHARLADPNGDYRLAATGVPAHDGEFDVAVSTNVIVEIPTIEELRRVTAEITRVVKAGGWLALMTGSEQSYRATYSSFGYSVSNKIRDGLAAVCTIQSPDGDVVVQDTVWTTGTIRKTFEACGWRLSASRRPTAPENNGRWFRRVPPPFVVMLFSRPADPPSRTQIDFR